jgi:hypothetical protein
LKPQERKEDRLSGRTYYTDNPTGDWDRYVAEEEEALSHLPVCDECGEHSEYLYDVPGAGILICEECIKKYLHHYE